MGLFSKKPKELEYDAVECQNKKVRMRQIFNEAVADGDSYKILHATETTTKFEHGFVFDTNTTTFYHYILGYRQSDHKIVLVQIDRDLTQHSEEIQIDMSAVVEAHYTPKYYQALFLQSGFLPVPQMPTSQCFPQSTLRPWSFPSNMALTCKHH